MSSVLHRQTKNGGYFWTGRAISSSLWRRWRLNQPPAPAAAFRFGQPPPLTPAPERRAPLPIHKALLFALMCGLWLSAGLFARDPWKPQETDFVVAIAEHNGQLENLPAHVRPQTAPSLYFNMAAFSARLLSPWLPQHEGARILNLVLLAAAFALLWFACGGRQSARAGWLGVLLAFGMTGLMVRAHLLNLAVPAFLGSALLVAAVSRLRRHALVGGIATAAAIGFLFSAAAPSIAIFAAMALLLMLIHPYWRRPSVLAGLAAAAAFALPLVALSPMMMAQDKFFVPHFWIANSSPLAALSIIAESFIDLLRTSLWALFPALPVVAAALWFRGRAILAEPLMFFCVCLIAAAAAHFLLYGGSEEDLFWLMPPLAIMAARGLEKLPHNMAVILDWFALIIVGLCGVGGMWAAWLLMHADSSSILMSGDLTTLRAEWAVRFPLLLSPTLPFWRAAAAASITILWIGLAANIGRSNERAALNWSCGIAVMWCVFNLLWVPFIDSGKSYRPMAIEVSAASDGACVSSSTAAGAAAAQIYYFGVVAGNTKDCELHLQKADESPPSKSSTDSTVWQGGRYGAMDYILYRRF